MTAFWWVSNFLIVHRTCTSHLKRLQNQGFQEEKEEVCQRWLRHGRTALPQPRARAWSAAAPPVSCPSPPPAKSSSWTHTWRSAHYACSVSRAATSHDSPPVPTERALTASDSTCALRYPRAGWALRARSALKHWPRWTSVLSWMTGLCWSASRSSSWDVSWLLTQIHAGAPPLTAGEVLRHIIPI